MVEYLGVNWLLIVAASFILLGLMEPISWLFE
jgi:hypothetical protein